MQAKEEFKNQSNVKYIFYGFISLVIVTVITLISINKTGRYPWGENIYKYIATKNIFFEFNIIVGLNIILGGFGFILWGSYFNRKSLCYIFALLWFFIPTNLRVLFSEGNVAIAFINSILPYLVLVYYKTIQENKFSNYIFLILINIIIATLNATIAIMFLVVLYLAILVKALINDVDKKNILILTLLTVVTIILRFTIVEKYQNWILPKSVEYLVYPLADSFNPLIRAENIQVFYLGIVFLIIIIFGLMFSENKNSVKWFFAMALLLFLGTSSSLKIFYDKLPISEFLVFSRIASLGVALVLLAIVRWVGLNKLLLLIMCFFISMEAFVSFDIVGFNRDLPEQLMAALDIASGETVNKIAILDSTTYGSFVNYYLQKFNEIDEEKILFTNKWMTASNKDRLIQINTALENNYYLFMLDKTLESGADTILIKKSFVKNELDLQKSAKRVGYEKLYEDDEAYIFKYSIENSFSTKTNYDAVAIGDYASNIIYNFPNIKVGESVYLDDYNIEELKEYKTIFLSGFKYRDQNKAEKMLLDISETGIRVVVDIVGFDEGGFLGVIPQSFELFENYGKVYYKGKEIHFKDFPEDIKRFRSNYISNIKVEDNTYAVENTLLVNYLNYKNDNLVLLGLNIPYDLFLTKDNEAMKIMEDLLNMKANTLPTRELIIGEKS